MLLKRRLFIPIIALFFVTNLSAQEKSLGPYDSPHADAPVQLADYADLIGKCECQSHRRNPDGTWKEPVKMIWRFKYVLGGFGVQDESWKEDGTYGGSLRQFNADSTKWVVTYFSSSSVAIPTSHWTGAPRKGNEIVLYRPQAAPNGMDGFSRLKFYDIEKDSFKWVGEWVDKNETITYPFWKIDCKRIKN